MLFTEPLFFLLVAVTFALYYAPLFRKLQIWVLIAASLVFYAYDQPWLLLLLLFSATVSAAASRLVLVSPTIGGKRLWATLGVTANLAILVFFKYHQLLYHAFFRAEPAQNSFAHTLLTLPLPIGISFYTFHGISLMVDVFRQGNASGYELRERDRDAVRHFERTFLYLIFFPQLIAGPIVKARVFFPQIVPKTLRDINWNSAARALITGYFLKSVIADNLAAETFWIEYPYFLGFSAGNLLVLLVGYSMQIFADFAGYSLIAIGLGRLFGYLLPDNFNYPYISQTFSEFWTRWHISLSSWLREYLYFPLGGNRKGRTRTYVNVMVVMILGGLWHGGAWSYAVWGLWHGAALSGERALSSLAFYKSRLLVASMVRGAVVFGVVTTGWLLFKLPDFHHALGFVQTMWHNRAMKFASGVPLRIAIYSLPVVAYHAHGLSRERSRAPAFTTLRAATERLVLGAMLAAIVLIPGESNAFIYFQF